MIDNAEDFFNLSVCQVIDSWKGSQSRYSILFKYRYSVYAEILSYVQNLVNVRLDDVKVWGIKILK